MPGSGLCSPDGPTYGLDVIRPLLLPRAPTVLPYHLLGFGGFTAEGTGLPVGKVLGEVAVEHTEAP